MKKIISKMILCGAAITLASCNLDRYPESEMSEDTFYSNTQEVEYALVGVYNALQPVYKEQWRFTELRSDNVHLESVSSTDANNEEMRRLDHFEQSDQEPTVNSYWQNSYKVIARANKVLAAIDVVSNADQAAEIKGEALFLRSMMYLDLARLFGDVWYVTKPISGVDALKMEKTPVATILTNIAADLETAVAGLPAERPGSEAGRVTSYAAKALLAKVYLTQKDYAKVKSTLEPVIAAMGTTDLEPYFDIYKIDNEMNKEILFAVRYVSGNVGLGAPFQNYFGPRNEAMSVGIIGNSMGYNTPSDGINRLFGNTYNWVLVDGDMNETIITADNYAEDNQPDRISAVGVVPATEDLRSQRCVTFHPATYVWWCSKYYGRDEVKLLNDADNDWPVIRYADVLLMYAEALNSGDNNQADAATYVNAVRTRAGLAALEAADMADQATMHTSILRERRLEFAFENQRWFDMLREGTDYVKSTIETQYATEEFYWSYTSGRGPQPTILDSRILLQIPFNMTSLY